MSVKYAVKRVKSTPVLLVPETGEPSREDLTTVFGDSWSRVELPDGTVKICVEALYSSRHARTASINVLDSRGQYVGLLRDSTPPVFFMPDQRHYTHLDSPADGIREDVLARLIELEKIVFTW